MKNSRSGYRVVPFRDKYNPAKKWAVVHYSPDGKRQREKFTSKIEAQIYADNHNAESKSIGFQAWGMSDEQRMEAVKCFARLPEGYSLTDAVDRLLEHMAKTERTCSVTDAVAHLLAAKKKTEVDRAKSPRYVLELKSQLKPFDADFGARTVRELETDEIENWLHDRDLSPVSFNNARRYLSVLWSHCIKQKWASENPISAIEEEETDSKPAGVLTPEAMRCVITICRRYHPSILPGLLIQAFAGLRDAEVRRLTWDEVNLEDGHITVLATKSKTRSRRVIEISDNLKAFLKPYATEKGKVTNSCHRTRFAEVRATVLKEKLAWPTNALRHSFVSYRLAETGDENRTALEAGHTPSMLHEHYKGLVTKKAADEWWKISTEAPPAVQAEPVRSKVAPSRTIAAGSKVRPRKPDPRPRVSSKVPVQAVKSAKATGAAGM